VVAYGPDAANLNWEWSPSRTLGERHGEAFSSGEGPTRTAVASTATRRLAAANTATGAGQVHDYVSRRKLEAMIRPRPRANRYCSKAVMLVTHCATPAVVDPYAFVNVA